MKTYSVQSVHVDMPECIVRKSQYGNGTLAVMLYDTEGDQEVISLNLEAYGLIPADNQFYVKNYSEHEGLPDALENAGIAKKVGHVAFGPFDSTATLMELTL